MLQMQDVQTNGIEGKGIGIPIGIGECSHIKKAIVDKNARIGKNVMVSVKQVHAFSVVSFIVALSHD